MGIPVEGPTCIYVDNQSVLANTTIPDSTLKKKSQSIAYPFVHGRGLLGMNGGHHMLILMTMRQTY